MHKGPLRFINYLISPGRSRRRGCSWALRSVQGHPRWCSSQLAHRETVYSQHWCKNNLSSSFGIWWNQDIQNNIIIICPAPLEYDEIKIFQVPMHFQFLHTGASFVPACYLGFNKLVTSGVETAFRVRIRIGFALVDSDPDPVVAEWNWQNWYWSLGNFSKMIVP